METSLTLPNLGSSSSHTIKKAGAFILGASTLASPTDTFASYLSEVKSSGGNYSFVEMIQPDDIAPLDTAELYTRAVQSIRNICTKHEPDDQLPLEDSEKLKVIRGVFSPTGQQLADALGVSRTTVYNWLDGQSEVRPGNQRRLDVLFELARLWEGRKESSGKPLRDSEKRDFFHLLAEGTPSAYNRAKERLTAYGDAPNRPRPKSIQQLQRENQLTEWAEDRSKAAMAGRITSVSSRED